MTDQFLQDVSNNAKVRCERLEPVITEYLLVSIKIKQLNLKGFTIEDRPMNPELRELYMLQESVKDDILEIIEA
jgi:hypothetical protein